MVVLGDGRKSLFFMYTNPAFCEGMFKRSTRI